MNHKSLTSNKYKNNFLKISQIPRTSKYFQNIKNNLILQFSNKPLLNTLTPSHSQKQSEIVSFLEEMKPLNMQILELEIQNYHLEDLILRLQKYEQKLASDYEGLRNENN